MEQFRRSLVLFVLAVICLGMFPRVAHLQETAPFPLSERGPFNMVGRQAFSFVDETRDRTVSGYIWYPAGNDPDARPGPIRPKDDLPPDATVALFPLIFYSHPRSQDGVTVSTTLGAAPHLATYGFAVVSIDNNDPSVRNVNIMNRPLDLLFVLDQLAAEGGTGALKGLIDTQHVGVTGYSLGGTTTLLFSGARIDPLSRDTYCTTAAETGSLTCDFGADVWAEMLQARAQMEPVPVAGEPWPPFADDRIVAVMPVAPCHGPLFGERGLMSGTLPTLIIGLEKDETCLYERDALYIYEHLGSPERALLTVSKMGHSDAVFDSEIQRVFNHFTVAFFGYHLQGKMDYAQYLTADFVSGFDNLMWASNGE